MPTTSSRRSSIRPTRRWRSALLALGALVGAGSLVAGSSPAAAVTPPFGALPAMLQNAPGAQRPIIVGGDSLTVQAAGSGNGLAALMSQVTGRASMVSAAGGASWKTYYDGNQTVGNWTLPAYAYVTRPSVTVTALGSNDARILALRDPRYTGDILRQTAMDGLRDQMRWSRCALLVNTYTNSGDAGFPVAETSFMNLGMGRVAADMNAELGAKRVFVADWNSFATPHHSLLYPGGNIHLTPAGAAWYQIFIVAKANELLALPQCR